MIDEDEAQGTDRARFAVSGCSAVQTRCSADARLVHTGVREPGEGVLFGRSYLRLIATADTVLCGEPGEGVFSGSLFTMHAEKRERRVNEEGQEGEEPYVDEEERSTTWPAEGNRIAGACPKNVCMAEIFHHHC